MKAQSDDVSQRLKQTVEANARLHAETAQSQNALNAQCGQAAIAMEQNVRETSEARIREEELRRAMAAQTNKLLAVPTAL